MTERQYVHYGDTKLSKNQQVSFIPAISINCKPPYRKGRLDSCWKHRPLNGWPDERDQAACERLVGMSLLPLRF